MDLDPLTIVCFGELLIDFVPTVNGVSLADAPAFKKAPGGAPANVAAGLAKLGVDVAFMGKVGDDEFGHMLARVLKRAGVNTQALVFDPMARTALAFVTLKEDGEREFMFYRHPSADMLFRSDEIDRGLLAQTSIFHYGSISLISEPSRSAHKSALETAKAAGALLSYDPNLRLPLWSSPSAAKKGIMSLWGEADLIKISDEELTFLTGSNNDSAAKGLLYDQIKLLLVTEGAGGCRYYTQDFSGRVAGFLVDSVDTTGAGDAFVAGFLSQLAASPDLWLHEEELAKALRFANAAGAITTTERGAIPALPDRAAVEKMLLPPDEKKKQAQA